MAKSARGRGCGRWLLIGVGVVVVLAAVGVTVFLLATRNPEVGAFYDPPDEIEGEPGTILRSEPFDDGLPAGTQGWRILYVSTDAEGEPIADSGLVLASTDPPDDGPRPVLAWAHGTTGIARPCAPSLSARPLEGIPDMTGPLDQGWILTLTDYPGLGTPSPHPYLVGESEGRAVLDSVRAARALDTGLEVDDQYAVWGHSQGGHAALFAGQLADEYLPELPLVGVAALAPATDLQANLAAIEGTQIGDVLTVFTVDAWTDVYPDIPDGTLADEARRPAGRLVDNCINQPSRFRLLAGAAALPDRVVAIDPTTDPAWAERLAENTPDPAAIEAPVLVAQGLADEVIDAGVTEAWVRERCETARSTLWITYEDVNHNGVVGPGGATALSWTIDRFAGVVEEGSCPDD